jgi:hypothetical protein
MYGRACHELASQYGGEQQARQFTELQHGTSVALRRAL